MRGRNTLMMLALASCALLCYGASTRTLSLGGSTEDPSGSPWTVRNHNGTLVIPATVPGVVHLDLLRAKKITEPYYRYGELDLAWVHLEPSWTFTRSIAPGALGANPGRVLLRSEGIDTVATVTLNGHVVGQTTNMFHRPVWDVTSAFQPAAENTLEVRIDSPALASSANHAAYPYPVSGSYITPLQFPSCGCPDPAACFTEAKGCDCLIKCKHSGHDQTTRQFMRKSQAHWGWDWGAGFLTSGIFRELSLVGYNRAAVIRDVVVQIFPESHQQGQDVENPTSTVHATPTSFRVELDIFLMSDHAAEGTTISAAIPSLGAKNLTEVSLGPGELKVRVSLELKDVPQSALWYPNGYGDAVLHNLTVAIGETMSAKATDLDKHILRETLDAPSGAGASRWTRRIGLKSVEIVQEPLPPGLPCGRADCGGGPTCSDTTTGGPYTCAFQKANGKCNQSLTPWHVPLGYCCTTCFGCSAECLAVNNEKLQPGGLSMVFRVNGVPVFIKGANWIATDQFEPRIPQRKGAKKGGEYTSDGAGFEALLDGAKQAHFNMLRVWGGGIFERDDFYDIADEAGIMIWEEGKFACSLYPRNKEFLDSVATEVTDQIRRLSHHASLAVYSGNNENMGPGMATDQTLIDYSVLYTDTLQTAIRAVDQSRPYWPASPSNGAIVDDPDEGLYIQRWGDQGDSRYGDAHLYPQFGRGEVVDCEDLSKFQTARFVSEYGFISMESWASMASMTLPDDLTADGNSSMMFFRMRQDWPNGQEVLLGQLGLHFNMPGTKNQTEAYKDLTYLSQVVHAHCLTLSSSHFRLMRGSAAGTMGLMFWSLNNQWQGQSDAAIDYTGRWKLLLHATNRFYAPMLLHLHAGWDTTDNTGWNETNITTGIVNDTPYSGKGVATVVLRSWATGAALRTWNVSGTVPAYSSYNFSKFPRATYLDGHVAEAVFLTATISLQGVSFDVARAHHYFTKMKAAELKDPEVKLAFGPGLNVTVSCTAPTPHAFLDPGELKGHFSDNGFLLLPDEPVVLSFDPMGEQVSPETLRSNTVVRTPFSTMHG